MQASDSSLRLHDLSSPLGQALISSLDQVIACADAIDVVVIGSGAAGVAAALELAEQGRSVALLEAGSLVFLQHVKWLPFRTLSKRVAEIERSVTFPIFWETSESSLLPGEPAGKGWSLVGGRTIFWGGCIPRFQEHDFSDWPISLADLEEDYAWAEDCMYLSGPGSSRQSFFWSKSQDALIAGLREAGFPACELPLAVDTCPTANGYVPRGFDSSIARLLRSDRLVRPGHGPGILLVTESPVVRLEHDWQGVTAIVVEDRRLGSHRRLPVAKVVLAAGTLQSVRLALASGLEAVHPLVGRYVGDHIFVRGVLELAEPLGDASAYLFIPAHEKRPFQVQIQGSLQDDWYDLAHTHPLIQPKHGGRYLLFYAFAAGSMSPENRVLLGSAQNRGSHHPLDGFRVQYRRSGQEKATIEAIRHYIMDLAIALGARVVECTELPPGSSQHEIGGLRMSKEPRTGVTDPDARFWHLPNLYVADASAWPSQGAANPTLTITAMARRLARQITT